MALQELVDYVQQSLSDPQEVPDFQSFPHHETPIRQPPPPWLEGIDHAEIMPDPFRRGEEPLIDLPEDGYDGSSIRIPVSSKNPDVLAYYRPFHFHSNRWGIFVWEEGLLYLASVLKGKNTLVSGDESYVIDAWRVLVEHERLHFTVEIACSRAELVARSPLYIRYFRDKKAARREEALANAKALRTGLNDASSTVKNRAKTWMNSQGPGYSDYGDCLADRAFKREQEASVGRFLTSLHIDFTAENLGPVSFLYNRATQLGVPVYLIETKGSRFRLVDKGRRFPKDEGMRIKVHTREHLPPHYHIFLPPHEERTRYQWPEHEPVKGDPFLSNAEDKKLEKYLSKHGDKVRAKIEKVFNI